MLGEHEFRRFMETYWAVKLDHFALNLLEYYGLVLPVRKALVDGLLPPPRQIKSEAGIVTESYCPKWEYVHRRYKTLRRRAVTRGEDDPGESPRPISICFPPHHSHYVSIDIDRVRPTPWFLIEPYAELPAPSAGEQGQRTAATDLARWAPAGLLRRWRRWLRPVDLDYWALLGLSLGHPLLLQDDLPLRQRRPPRPQRSTIKKLSLDFRLDPALAAEGNVGVDRFYVVGWGSGTRRNPRRHGGSVGAGPGQDWLTAALLSRLRSRADLYLLLRVAEAEQGKTINRRLAAFEALARRSSRLRSIPDLAIPRIRSTFYQDVVSHLAFRQLRRVQTPQAAYRWLAVESGHTADYVRKVVSRGGQFLRVDTTYPL